MEEDEKFAHTKSRRVAIFTEKKRQLVWLAALAAPVRYRRVPMDHEFQDNES